MLWLYRLENRNPDLVMIAISVFLLSPIVWAWIKAIFWGLIVPDKYSLRWLTKVARWYALIEYSPYWMAPVGLPMLLFGAWFLIAAFDVNWLTLGISVALLAIGGFWLWLIIRKRTHTTAAMAEE